jgi:hypothetical protein
MRAPENVFFFLLGVAVIAIYFVLSSEQSAIVQYHHGHQAHSTEQNRPAKQTRTNPNSAPLQPLSQDHDGAQESKDTGEKSNEFLSAKLTDWLLALFTLALVIFTRRLYLATAGLFSETRGLREAAIQQSADMRDSINTATRAAVAMENVATHMEASAQSAVDTLALGRERTAMQMRAYLSVVIGAAVYQERDKNLRFEGKPYILNSGNTPAHNVRYLGKAEITPVLLPDDFDFSLDAKPWVGSSVVGPHQNAITSVVVDNFVDDTEIDNIKRGTGPVLRVWGTVLYDDAFGESHFTNFHQILTWLTGPQGEMIFGIYPPTHNDAN